LAAPEAASIHRIVRRAERWTFPAPDAASFQRLADLRDDIGGSPRPATPGGSSSGSLPLAPCCDAIRRLSAAPQVRVPRGAHTCPRRASKRGCCRSAAPRADLVDVLAPARAAGGRRSPDRDARRGKRGLIG